VCSHLGAGGMGAVYRVERVSDGRALALKVLRRTADPEALARFAREAQIAAQVDHANVVRVLDVDVTRSGMLFLVMELVEGPTLAEERARYGDAGWAVPVLRQIAAALQAMHERGIVHRDLKPSNVLVDATTVKVADFGIASLVDPAPDEERADHATTWLANRADITHPGMIMGTPLYMAPELYQGAQAAVPGSDVFSWGVVAYELLANRLPYTSCPVTERSPPRSRDCELLRRDGASRVGDVGRRVDTP
jgi:serine/threonine-protein kinase